jgi:thiol-disulfide isomerase/thioredoxin
VTAYLLHSRLLLTLAAVWLVVLPILLARTRRRDFDPFDPFWLFSAVFLFTYVLIPGVQLWRPAAFQSLPGFLTYSPPDYYAAAWLGGAAFCVFCLVYLWPSERPRRWAGATAGGRAGILGLAVTGGALIAAGLLALELNLRLANASALSPRSILTGGLRNALLRTEQGRGYINLGYLALSTGIVCLGIAMAMWSEGRLGRGRWVWTYFIGAAGAAILLFALILGSRNLAIQTVVGLLVAFHFRYRRIPTRFMVAALVVLAIGAVEFLSLRNMHHLTADPITMSGNASKTFDGFNFLVSALARVHHLLWGRSFGQDFLYTYLPRQLFPGKPTVYGVVLAQNTVVPGLSTTVGIGTFPVGILAEGYVNFGLAGLFLMPVLAAILLRLSYDWVKATTGAVSIVVFGYLLGNPTAVFRSFGPVVPALLILLVLLAGLQLPEQWFRQGRRTILPAAALFAALAVAVPAVAHPQITSPSSLSASSSPLRSIIRVPPALSRLLAPNGKPTMIVFWSSWCGACGGSLRAAHAVAQSSALTAVAVDLEDTGAAARAAKARFHGPIVPDDGTITIGTFRQSELPAVVFLRGRTILCEVDGGFEPSVLTEAAARLAIRGTCQ